MTRRPFLLINCNHVRSSNDTWYRCLSYGELFNKTPCDRTGKREIVWNSEKSALCAMNRQSTSIRLDFHFRPLFIGRVFFFSICVVYVCVCAFSHAFNVQTNHKNTNNIDKIIPTNRYAHKKWRRWDRKKTHSIYFPLGYDFNANQCIFISHEIQLVLMPWIPTICMDWTVNSNQKCDNCESVICGQPLELEFNI